MNYNAQKVAISTMKELQFCGLWYCRNEDREYELNIKEKIEKLEHKKSKCGSQAIPLSKLAYCRGSL